RKQKPVPKRAKFTTKRKNGSRGRVSRRTALDWVTVPILDRHGIKSGARLRRGVTLFRFFMAASTISILVGRRIKNRSPSFPIAVATLLCGCRAFRVEYKPKLLLNGNTTSSP